MKLPGGWPLWLTAVALALLQLWTRPLLPVDETRYLGVAWEMWNRGDFLVPYLNAEPYSHKPPLLFWSIQLAWSVFGVSAWSARLVTPLVALACLWLTASIARKLWPQQHEQIEPLVPWLLFGGLFWMNFYTLVQFDLWLTLAALIVWRVLPDIEQRPLGGGLLLALGTGLGILAKGPVILLPILPAILLAPWWSQQNKPRSWLRWYGLVLGAFAAGVVLALAWAIPAGQAGGELYRQAIFWGQSAGRVVNSFAHQNPWWSYLWWLPLMWLPWVLWPRLWKAMCALLKGRWDDGSRFCVAVLLPALVLFSLISGKQGKYLLPLFPLIALLMARALANMPAFLQPLSVLGLRFNDTLAAVRGMALSMVLLTAVLYLVVVPRIRESYDLVPVSERLSQIQSGGFSLAWLGKYHGQFQFPGRLRQRIEPLSDVVAVKTWLRDHPQGFLLVYYRDVQKLPDDISRYPYRSGELVLWPAAELLQLPQQLDELPGNA